MSIKYEYIIADHLRASCLIIADGVQPTGKQRGYILRRLIRRSLSACLKLDIDIQNPKFFEEFISKVVQIYDKVYPEIEENKVKILQIFLQESEKYNRSIKIGKKEWAKILKIKSKNS